MKFSFLKCFPVLAVAASITACSKSDNTPITERNTITIENVLDSRPLVQSGTFMGSGDPPVIFPGQSVSFSFYAGKGQTLTFATMYGWSNDLFFAPENPGIALYQSDGAPITGDVSSQIKLWDNGTRVNEKPGMGIAHPGTPEATTKNISEVNGTDAYGHTYLAAAQLMNVSLAYNGNSNFTITITNKSAGTANETPFSPGVWAISYVAGGNQLLPNAIFTAGQPTANGLTNIAEAGDNAALSAYLTERTGLFTPLSPVLVVVYHGDENPFFTTGEHDRGEGLKALAQTGNADILAAALKAKPGVKEVHVLKESMSTVLLPKANGGDGGKVSQELSVVKGDRLAIATMYGFSNDWFFATKGNGVDATEKGDISTSLGLFDNGTAIDQFPGAGLTQANLEGTPLEESKPIEAVPHANPFTSLPSVNKIIKVNLQ
ncbi:spondin domain-containing protein [Niabella insulamsoli]|uniref:spondin domain-containing protein n=1 Tax=Niabella insulamsoli TaxID=3144874 RepID=UPI0031FCCC45